MGKFGVWCRIKEDAAVSVGDLPYSSDFMVQGVQRTYGC